MSFRQLLQNEFDRRRALNPRYSLRAFAAALRVDHATLSQILRGRRRITSKTIRSLAPRLGIPPQDVHPLCAAEHDLAVLAAIARPRFRADSRWIASMCGIPLDEVNLALQRLLAARRLVMAAPQRWEIVHA